MIIASVTLASMIIVNTITNVARLAIKIPYLLLGQLEFKQALKNAKNIILTTLTGALRLAVVPVITLAAAITLPTLYSKMMLAALKPQLDARFVHTKQQLEDAKVTAKAGLFTADEKNEAVVAGRVGYVTEAAKNNAVVMAERALAPAVAKAANRRAWWGAG